MSQSTVNSIIKEQLPQKEALILLYLIHLIFFLSNFLSVLNFHQHNPATHCHGMHMLKGSFPLPASRIFPWLRNTLGVYAQFSHYSKCFFKFVFPSQPHSSSFTYSSLPNTLSAEYFLPTGLYGNTTGSTWASLG